MKKEVYADYATTSPVYEGYSEEKALSALRFTISNATQYEDIEYVIEKTKKVISLLRNA